MMKIQIEYGAAQVVRALLDAGYRAYVVGGCVRDALLGRQPHDWDICTGATPEETMALFGEEKCIPTGLKHGTVSIKMAGGIYEVTTFRTDGDYSDGRHPDKVDFVSDVRDDLARRDFTINAMAYNAEEGLIDPFGGQQDLLCHRLVRAVGDPYLRFGEDSLRVMRLFRFAARFGLAIEEKTLAAALDMKETILRVSPERLREELIKTLMTAQPAAYLPYGVIGILLPEFAQAAQRDGADAQAIYARSLAAVNAVPAKEHLRMAALLHPLGAETAKSVTKRFRCSGDQTDGVYRLLTLTEMPIPEDPVDLIEAARRALDRYGIETLTDAGCLADQILPEDRAQALHALIDQAAAAHARGDCCALKTLHITGEDLIEIVGVKKGVLVGRTLNHLLTCVLRDELANEREALLGKAREIAAGQ